MFDLEQSIAEWRRQMVRAGIKTPVPLVELEAHLREEVEDQMRAGVRAQLAFQTAVQRVGKPELLKAEFDRAATPVPKLHPKYLSIFCLVSAPLLLLINIWVFQPGEIGASARFWSLAAISLLAVYIGGLPYFHDRLPSPGNPVVRGVMLVGWVLALLWPIVATLISVGIVRLHIAISFEMMIWATGLAWFATWLSHAVAGSAEVGERSYSR